MAVQREIQVEAIVNDLVTGLTVNGKQDRHQSTVCCLERPAQLTATKLDQKRRHGCRDVHHTVIKPVADAEYDKIGISWDSWSTSNKRRADDSLCDDVRHRRQDQPPFLLTLLS